MKMQHTQNILSLLLLLALCYVVDLAASANQVKNRKSVGNVTENDKSKQPECDRTKMENCILQLTMIGDDNFVFPTNSKQMSERCRQLKPLQQCVKEQVPSCFLARDTVRYIMIMVYSITKTNRAYCRNVKQRNAFVKFGQCVNENREELNKFWEAMNRNFHAIKHVAEGKNKIAMVCCNYIKMKNQISTLINNKCAEHWPEIERLVDGYVGDLINAGCGEYNEETDLCDSIIESTPKWHKPLQHKDFLTPLVQILEQNNK